MNNSYKLISAGNTNVPAMINAIVRATIQLRIDLDSQEAIFRQVHIFHTEQSLEVLMASQSTWKQVLAHYHIPITCLIHHVTKIEDSNEERFKDLVDQLRTIVNPLDNSHYYVDLTSGISALKTILAVFAYVLDIQNIYSLEVKFSNDRDERRSQTGLFFDKLEEEEAKSKIEIEYRKFPSIREFDTFGKFNYTEVLRHHKIIDELTDSLAILLPSKVDLEHLRSSLLSGTNARLLAETTGEEYNYRHSVFSFSAGIEEAANILLTILKDSEIENKTLGQKLGEIRGKFEDTPKYFINAEVLEHLTRLITEVRNNIAHPTPGENNKELVAIQSQLSAQLALTFFRFTIKTVSAFLNSDGKLVDFEILNSSEKVADDEIFYFGFDGDATGDYIEVAFTNVEQSEDEVLKRSQKVRKAIEHLKNTVSKRTKNNRSTLFAEDDNLLFKAVYNESLLLDLQAAYKKQTGLCSSIGYGRTLKESTIALRLAKANPGDSIIGIEFKKANPKMK